jgi:hypothetical protein
MRNDYKIRPRQELKKGGKAFPDLNKDGKTTYADVLILLLLECLKVKKI